ncbi:hypothetical protein [Roseinatronobacter monicus]|uniref:hypothetical protein n=1 Tax=Roseinatronobacter monicus TaxID=393481 RepID=UPI003F2A4161
MAAAHSVAREHMQGRVVAPAARPDFKHDEALSWADLVEQRLARHLHITNAEIDAMFQGARWAYSDPVAQSVPEAGQIATVKLQDTALAVSSPAALMLDTNAHHILHPHVNFQPIWSSVAVVARRAAIADGFSTAGCYMKQSELQACASLLDGIQQVLVSQLHGARYAISVPI